VREDQILPHLAAIPILLAVPARKPHRPDRGLAQLTGPDGSAALTDQLRAGRTVLSYDPASRTGGRPPFSALHRYPVFRPIPTSRQASTVPVPDNSSCQYTDSVSSCRLRPRLAINTPLNYHTCCDKH
jgi:hypothetical protein